MAEQTKVEVKVDVKALEAKIDKNEKLTPAEEQFLMETQPAPEDFGGKPGPQTEESVESEDNADQTLEEKQAAEDKKVADQKIKDGLADRAKAAGLPETATQEEIEAAEKTPEDNKVDMLKIEEQLQQEEGKVDLTGLSKREQAYYWRMRKEQKRASQAEADRDAALFKLSKIKKEDLPAEEPKEVEEDPFKDRDDSDFITVAELKKLRAKAIKNIPAGPGFLDLPLVQSFIKSCDEKAAAEKSDYAEVMELTVEIINTNPAYQKEVADALIKGDNPALKIYELIKADPEYAKLLPAAQTRVLARKGKKSDEKPKEKTPEELNKEKVALAAQDKMDKNNQKEKTSGHAEGKDKIEGTDLTIEQISKMGDAEFSKLPKKVRQKYLELYG
jgi:hypothetical protein